MTFFAPPVMVWHGDGDAAAPMVVLLHGRGSNETDIIGLADHRPAGPAYAAVRAPSGERGGFAWFANRGIGRPTPESLAETMASFLAWLNEVALSEAGGAAWRRVQGPARGRGAGHPQ